ncbi:MAG: dprA [Aeromicrobium sp.]|jgi:DNA processing protein|nr:dprA [Aeromicrobium sp.]
MSHATETSRDRLALCLLVEPGDPRLPELLAAHEPGRLVSAIRGGRGIPGLTVPQAWGERAHDLDQRLAQCLDRAGRNNLRWIVPGDPEWPARLDDLDHVDPLHGTTGAPLGLWLRGTGDLAELTARSVAIVGARSCTTYGAECASDLGADLTDAGWTVVSGAAYGIDACAHRGALAMAGPTVAVLACGADIDYPRSHSSLLGRIAEEGLVISEQPPGQVPMRPRFLSRNRIIAALSAGTVVVEAAVRSGSLNTLHRADQLGRVTMALPGPVTSVASGGAHAAVRDGRAVLVTNGREVLQELRGLGAEEPVAPVALTELDRLPAAARTTLDGLDWLAVRSMAQIARDVGLTAREVRAALALLERRELVARQGEGWVLLRRADTA